ncbi:cytoplasmic protein [Kwoniella heveanensis BCC8398]|uniref:Cytoplasmic protein n=1 Tax=Kwoniella heveanensis BCC8398 TaxID=1296120 RepID=A0A1B9GLB0_9TREE|nr:cytoplasmic protein [Kwoniella heveanensis BCC8398]
MTNRSLMAKRLNKRQQREQEELQLLQSTQPKEEIAPQVSEGEGEENQTTSGPVNAFAALGGDDAEEDEEDEEDDTPAIMVKKSKKKKNKKKKSTTITLQEYEEEDASTAAGTPSKGGKKKKGKNDPFAGLDEVDRALAELKLQYGEDKDAQAGPSRTAESAGEARSTMAFRNLLSVDPKNLDADAELRRFFGSKVITSSAQSGPNKHRPGPSAKLRYTISKPKPTYPPATSLAGLIMREMIDTEVDELYERRERQRVDKGEKWFTFEHAGAWREIERQFMGAVRSHDPNELMALLQVYPWHVDTLLQMSEVYRLQSDIGAASDFAERALYAFDRCLMPSFSVSSGASRLDFDRVENRPMFTALHRIISYLGRRGCWVTAFNFAKLLYALDPENDPHGAVFWLDFLAVKSGNGSWLLSMLEQGDTSPAAASWFAYPGMAYAKALALRAEEESTKNKDHTKSDGALQEAITDFPQVVTLLADKTGASLPEGARSEPLFQVEAGYTDAPSNVVHLLSHIYVSRSEALWKDEKRIAWFSAQVKLALPKLNEPDAKAARDDILALVQSPRDPLDDELSVPLYICRHVLCSESTSWLGFLPPAITSRPFHAYDPLPPTTATSVYDNAYFSGVRQSGRGGRGDGSGGGGGVMMDFVGRVFDLVQANPADWQDRVMGAWRDLTGRREFQGVPQQERDNVFQAVMQLAGNVAQGAPGATGEAAQQGAGTGAGGMPGGFPGAAGAEDSDAE